MRLAGEVCVHSAVLLTAPQVTPRQLGRQHLFKLLWSGSPSLVNVSHACGLALIDQWAFVTHLHMAGMLHSRVTSVGAACDLALFLTNGRSPR